MIVPTEFAPADQPGLEISQEPFAWTEVGHPHIIARGGHAATAKSGHQDSQSVLARFDLGKYRFRLNHRFIFLASEADKLLWTAFLAVHGSCIRDAHPSRQRV